MSLAALIKKSSLRGIATATPATFATDEAQTTPSVATVATVAVATGPGEAANDVRADRDQYARARDQGAFCEFAESTFGTSTRARVREAQADPDPQVSTRAEDTPVDLDSRDWPNGTGLSRAEAQVCIDRRARFLAGGQTLDDAERLAEMLVIRDREGDDRRLCLECSYYGSSGRCVAAATGRLPGVAARLEPVPTILWRCDAFGLRKGRV